MQKTKNINIIILVIICIYSLLSQFYLLRLGNYYTYIINPLFFAILAVITALLIGTSYKSGEFKKIINIYVGIAAVGYIFLYLLSGVLVTYGNNPYNITIKGLLLNLYSIGFVIFTKEFIRFRIINNSTKEDKNIFIVTVVIFSILELFQSSMVKDINFYNIFKLVFMNIIPIIVKNSLFTYTAKYSNFIPAVMYELIINMVLWVSPVLPKIPWVYTAVADTLFPLILLYYIKYEISKKDKRHIYKMQKSTNPKSSFILAALVAIIIFFALGLFPIKPIGIASGSMYPTYSIGDMVFVLKCDAKDLKIGDVIEYKRKNFSVIHRIKDMYIRDEKIYIITQGDNNTVEDADPVEEKQVQGKVIASIPYIAYPTIWINQNRSAADIDIELGK